jgi:hypothetical protein
MKLFKVVTIGTGDEAIKTETPILEKDIKEGDDIHVCRHEEGKSCKLLKNITKNTIHITMTKQASG